MAEGRKLAVLGYAATVLVLVGVGVGGVKLLKSLSEAWRDIEAFDSALLPWDECRLALPDDSVGVVYSQRPAHGLAAVFERQVRMERQGEPPVVRWLPPSAAGSTDVNVYWYASAGASGPLLRLQYRWGACIVDLPGQTVSVLGRRDGITHAVETPGVDDGPTDPLWVRTEGAGGWRLGMGANVGRSLSGWPPETGGTYIGRIDCGAAPLRFVTADAEPEEEVETEDWGEVP